MREQFFQELGSVDGMRVLWDSSGSGEVVLDCERGDGNGRSSLKLTPRMVLELANLVFSDRQKEGDVSMQMVRRWLSQNPCYRLQRKTLGIFWDTWSTV